MNRKKPARTKKSARPLVGIAMGSDSDWPILRDAANVLESLGVPYEKCVVSAHRTPDDMAEYGRSAASRGLKVIVAGAGGAAHLPGMLAAYTLLPVIGVPVPTKNLKGLDSLLSIVQMPGGIPVATVAIGSGINGGLLAAQILATNDDQIRTKLEAFRREKSAESRAKNRNL